MVEKRRRKKARIQAESSSEDESASDVSREDSVSELEELSEDELPHASNTAPASNDDIDEEHPRERLHKAPQNQSSEFSQLFLNLVTEQFGEELAALREANDFGPASIAQLVAGLKQGVDIFSEEQRRML